jgi:predicted PolB exonuclease-like 3'-5' exonuclease
MSLNAIANVTARPGLQAPGGAARLAAGATLLDGHAPAAPQRHRPDRPEARTGVAEPAGLHQALLVLDIETVPDEEQVPSDWPSEKFPKAAWHKVVAVSFVEAAIARDAATGTEAYQIRSCRSGGEPGWDEERLLRAFWKFFAAGRYRVVTWNGRSFDLPTLLLRSLMHGIAVPSWYRRGTKWDGYGHRYAVDWHSDLMEVLAEFGACARLTLEEAAGLLALPGKLGEHGSQVAAMIARGEIGRVRAYCETDCLNLFVLYLRWAHLTGRTGPEAHDAAIDGLIRYLGSERAARPHLGAFVDAWRRATESRSAFVSRPPQAWPAVAG